jgi:hypothetical protein
MSPVYILVARLKAILALQEHCIGAGESKLLKKEQVKAASIQELSMPIAQSLAYPCK